MATASDRVVTVFGGTGFLGRRIVHHLRLHGFRVRVASRHPDCSHDTIHVESARRVAAQVQRRGVKRLIPRTRGVGGWGRPGPADRVGWDQRPVCNSHSQLKITVSRAMPLAHIASGSF
jgi:hypothetical protein